MWNYYVKLCHFTLNPRLHKYFFQKELQMLKLKTKYKIRVVIKP